MPIIIDMIEITCTIDRIRYYKDGWGIVEVTIDEIRQGQPKMDGANILVLKGEMFDPVIGNSYEATAQYEQDPKWGEQYKLTSFYSSLGSKLDNEEIRRKFLQSLYTELQVENMYKALDDPFQSLRDKDVMNLIKVKGCGFATANKWIKKFNDKFSLILIYTELSEYNLTNHMVEQLVARYIDPEVAVAKIKKNPYLLCSEVKDIGWKRVDHVALESGIEKDDIRRISAYIYQYLVRCGREGRSWITPDELMGAILENLGEEIPDENITKSIHNMEDNLWWNEDKTKIGLEFYYDIENKIAQELIRIREADSSITYDGWEDMIKHLEHQQGWKYTEEQIQGIKTALENNVVLIHGLAGTGKSTLVSAIIEILRGYSYAQCALSGRAASRMSEITGEEGYTIHRLLGYPAKEGCGKGGFTFHDEHPLKQNIIIVDEISMIDSVLFYNLIRAVASGSKLICLGDLGQLESIGSGNVAHDIIQSGEIPIVFLQKIHRQAQASAIITESIKIRQGVQIINKQWVGREIRGELKDLELICYSDKSNTFYDICQAFSTELSSSNFNITETQVIVPRRDAGMASTSEINNALQELYNPRNNSKKEVQVQSYILRVGDKVINVKNNYSLEPAIYNGNIGILTDITYEFNEKSNQMEQCLVIQFNGIGEVKVPQKYWKSIELGYAITVHKSQGSQWDNVICGLDFSAYSLLTRELLYTAITRAKHKCTIIAQTGALRMAVGKEGVSKKQTHLADCLYAVAHPKLIF